MTPELRWLTEVRVPASEPVAETLRELRASVVEALVPALSGDCAGLDSTLKTEEIITFDN